MSNNSQLKNVYKNTLQIITTTIAAMASSTPEISCLKLNGSGAGTLRFIDFPSNWTAGDVTFEKSNTSGGLYLPWYTTDGATATGLLVFPGVAASTSVNAPNPAWFDAVPYLKIFCSNAQTELVTLTLGFQPIYQGDA